MKPPNLAKDSDTWFLALVAMRYCIGRRSYAPSLCAHWIMRHWPIMPSQTRAMMRRDLGSEIRQAESHMAYTKSARCEMLGDTCDEMAWRDLHAWMLARPAEEYANGRY